jgi:DNA-binding CsgD family transcriptional regulator
MNFAISNLLSRPGRPNLPPPSIRAGTGASVVLLMEAWIRDLNSMPWTALSRSSDPDDASWAPLTARKFEVARLVADGGTNAAIAAELGLSARTVVSHVEHILAKLGADRRAEIAAWAATLAARSGDARRVASRS